MLEKIVSYLMHHQITEAIHEITKMRQDLSLIDHIMYLIFEKEELTCQDIMDLKKCNPDIDLPYIGKKIVDLHYDLLLQQQYKQTNGILNHQITVNQIIDLLTKHFQSTSSTLSCKNLYA